MRAVVQRVSAASVEAEASRATMQRGLLIYLGVDRDDGAADARALAEKVRHLRICADETGKLNLDVSQSGGEILVVSAFTVQADARRGRRPSFEHAASPDRAFIMYEEFCQQLTAAGVRVHRGSFGDHMTVHCSNDGPVCVLLDSRRAF